MIIYYVRRWSAAESVLGEKKFLLKITAANGERAAREEEPHTVTYSILYT